MKRLLILLLAVVLILCACDGGHNHTFSADYSSDNEYHWFACECGEKDGYEQHTWNKGSVTLQPTMESEGELTFTCTVCRAKKIEKIDKVTSDHTHTYAFEDSDETHHWNECVCGEQQGFAQHKWDAGVVTTPATEFETGIKTFTCTECEHKATVNIPAATNNGLSFLQAAHHRISDKLSATPLTVEAEIYVDPSVAGRAGAIFGNYLGIREDFLFEIYENGVPRFYYTDTVGNVKDIRFNNVDVRTGDWAHIALTFDFANRTISLYLNGEVAQTVKCDADLADDVTRYQFVVGGDNRSNNGNYFKGQIRSVSAYSDVRTAEEIAQSAKNGTNLYADDLILSYLLNKNSGGKDIYDLSGNGYTIPKEWLDSHEPALDYAYSFAVVGDTQWLSRYKPEEMERLYDWILANKDAKKIAHVFGLGDITDAWNTADKENEWIRAQQYISKLDGIIPYSLVRGNHDESKYFLKYFANETYMSQFDGFMVEGDIRNSYKLVKIGSTNYLFLTLDYGASDEMLEWANSVVVAHPNHRVVVTTHAYQGYDGGHLNSDNVPSSGNITASSDVDTNVGEPARDHNNGEQLWEKFVSKHPNIFLVLSGHTPLEDVFVLESEGVHGNVVKQMLIDPQWMDPQKGGVGMVCMLYFSADGSQMEVEWICTETGKYYKEMNQFQVDLTDSLNAPAHEFVVSYNKESHYKECACGYIHGEEAHTYDGGVLNADGFKVYSCDCGYKKVASATDDPTALELQALLEKHYNGGKYYRDTAINGTATAAFFDADKFWTTDESDCEITEEYLTLHDLIMGKRGELRLDLGWSYDNGVYSSVNENTVKGVRMFALSLKTAETSNITKVTVQEVGTQLIIQLWAGDSVEVQTTVGIYATITLVNHDGDTIGVEYVKSDADGFCTFIAPKISGLVAEYDYLILDIKRDKPEKTVFYSEIDVWDGTSVSESLSGSGTAEDPYLIQSGADLAYIAKVVNDAAANVTNFKGQYFKMTKSIDLAGKELKIGSFTASKVFHGYFDGNNCTIRGLKNTQSLFGMLKDGYIKNISVYGTVTTTEKKGVAGLVSYMSGATVENVTNYANITGVQQVAGVVGWLENNATTFAKNCVNYGTIKATSYQIGGIAGFAKGSLSDCTNFGDVTSTQSGYVGGIGGAAKDAKGIRYNCVNYGNISGTDYVGGVFGIINKETKNCYSYGKATATGSNVGEVVGGGASYLIYTTK